MPYDLERLKRALAGRYRLEREAGRGGMATVYLAHDLKHDRPVALKILKPELTQTLGSERFLREIALTARLDHPHILPLLDSGEADGLLYYVMPYVQGESLRERLKRERQLPLDEALRIAREVADALAHAHGLGVVHRDIKPENILLAGGHARVADFGIARAVRREAASSITETGLAVGTPAYMSPEQASGEREVDARTDVYALGSVVYEMLAGEPPFTGATAEAILARKSLEAVPSLRVVRDAVPQGVEEAITKALAKVPADRFVTASQFAEALERGRSAVGPRLPTALRLPSRRSLPSTAAALVLALAGAWWVTQRDPGPPVVTSLAVLPLVNLMGDPEQEYFVEGMHEALTAELSKIAALRVTSWTSAKRYRETDKAMPQIARELRVDGLIEGSVLREGDEVRITVQLIHGPTDRRLWGETYQRGLRDILALQSDVARAIAREVQVTLTPEDETRLAASRPVDPEAYQLWLKGNLQFGRATEEGFRRALSFYEDALSIDPGYAPAHAGVAWAHLALASWFAAVVRPEVLPQARQAAARALALDPALASAHSVVARIRFWFEWDWAGAERAFRREMALNPNGTGGYALFLAVMGRFEEAVELQRRVLERNPLSPVAYFELASLLSLTGSDEEALELFREGFDLAPEHPQGHLVINGFHYARRGEFEMALSHLERVMAHQETPRTMGWLGYLHASAGRRAEALAVVARLLQRIEEAYTYEEAEALAWIHMALGDHDEAFRWLETAYENREVGLIWLKEHWIFNPLRGDPRFANLLHRMSFPS